ncbi:MAG TPA: ribose-phosphate diphosphokinase, partial [Tepidiformaceae bacterium]
LRSRGCGDVIVAGYHAVLSGPAIARLKEADVREIVLTDSLPITAEKRLPNMSIIPIADQFGDAIGRIHSGQSVGALFQ